MALIAPDDHGGQPTPGPGPVRSWLERVPPLPDRHRLFAVLWWYITDGRRKLFALTVRSPYLLLCELRPIAAGFGRLVGAWARWCDAVKFEQAIAAAAKLGKADHHNPDRLERRRERRRGMSFAGAALGSVAVVWAAIAQPLGLGLAGFALVLLCDLVGRRSGHRPEPAIPAPVVPVLRDGTPLPKIAATIVERLAERWDITVSIARPMSYSADRREYEVWVTRSDELTTEVARDLEWTLGATEHAVRFLAPLDKNATVRRVVIRNGDPLAAPASRPFLPTGSRSITEPAPIGSSMTDQPFALDFCQHWRVVAGTGGGKTKWFLRSCVDAISACDDVALLGIDITRGPELPMWRGVFQRVAYTPEQADALLDEILAEVERRTGVLHDIATDDNPDNDADEWHPGLGAPYWIVPVDEYPQLAKYDGKNGKLDLLGKTETIIRTSRKTGIYLLMFGQKSGNSDFGSSVMANMCGGTLLGPCDESDTVRLLGTRRRDQGWTPHLLTAGTPDQVNDAGKAFVLTGGFITPDEYRAYSPGKNAEVKRRARQRIEDGLPDLYGRGRPQPTEAPIDGVEVPQILVDIERVFTAAGWPEGIPTEEVVAATGLTARALAAELRKAPVEVEPGRWRPGAGRNSVRGYLAADVRAALGRLG